MSCCHYQPTGDGLDTAFTVDASRITFGRGCLHECGDRAKALGMTRVALFSDPVVAELEVFDTARSSLRAAGIDVVTYTEVHVEPTDESFTRASAFAAEAKPDGYVSVGGGSVIDTAKAANLYASHPADFLAYVNPPVGEGTPVPGPLKPHIACPTTSGTGSEVTGIAIFDLLPCRPRPVSPHPRCVRPRRSSTPTAPTPSLLRWSPARGSTCCRTHWSRSPRDRSCAVPRRTSRACAR